MDEERRDLESMASSHGAHLYIPSKRPDCEASPSRISILRDEILKLDRCFEELSVEVSVGRV